MKTGKGKQKGKDRSRSAQAIEKRILRGVAKRAEQLLDTNQEEWNRRPGAASSPSADHYSFSEGLQYQANPRAAPGVTDHRAYVEGGLLVSPERFCRRAGVEELSKKFPKLSQVVRENPGSSARLGSVREAAAKRVAKGLNWKGLEPRARRRKGRRTL